MAKMSICLWCSTMFLMGPLRQLSKMFEKGRIVATLVYLVFMALTLFCAIKVRSVLCELTMLSPTSATKHQDPPACFRMALTHSLPYKAQ